MLRLCYCCLLISWLWLYYGQIDVRGMYLVMVDVYGWCVIGKDGEVVCVCVGDGDVDVVFWLEQI